MIQPIKSTVIENVIMSKMRGKVIYQGSFPATIGAQLVYVKPFDLPTGKGYQRPVNKKRCFDFAQYLSKGDDALFTPILLNAASHWEFVSYDRQRPNFGRLLCSEKVSLIDGQHRLEGATIYYSETKFDITVPFLAFHFLDEDEEIKLFDTINTKAKGIGPSLNKFLRRDFDDLSWVATELILRKDSPFYHIGSIIGKRTQGRHITLQNLYRTLHLLTSEAKISSFSKEEKLNMALTYYNGIKETLLEEWNDYKGFKLTHIVSLDALSMAGSSVLGKCRYESHKQINYQSVLKRIQRLTVVDWSSDGSLKYIKGLTGSKSLAADLKNLMLPS
jgi:DNA sulfur modification protein DndB